MTQVLVANGQTLNTQVLIFAFLLLLLMKQKNDIRMMIQFTFNSHKNICSFIQLLSQRLSQMMQKKNNLNDIVKVKYFCTYANINNNVNNTHTGQRRQLKEKSIHTQMHN